MFVGTPARTVNLFTFRRSTSWRQDLRRCNAASRRTRNDNNPFQRCSFPPRIARETVSRAIHNVHWYFQRRDGNVNSPWAAAMRILLPLVASREYKNTERVTKSEASIFQKFCICSIVVAIFCLEYRRKHCRKIINSWNFKKHLSLGMKFSKSLPEMSDTLSNTVENN